MMARQYNRPRPRQRIRALQAGRFTSRRPSGAFYLNAMPITKCAPTARWLFDYSYGRCVGIEAEGTTASGQAVKGTLRAENLAALKKLLIARGVPRSRAIGITIEARR